ncbi:MAG: CHAT domain-containing protein [Ferruginibacter sp.]
MRIHFLILLFVVMGATFVQAQSVKDLNLLVNQLTLEKNYKKALESAQKAVQLAEKEALPKDIDYLKAVNNLGLIFSELNKFAEAILQFEKALALAAKYYDKDNYLYLEQVHKLLMAHQSAGSIQKVTSLLNFYNKTIASIQEAVQWNNEASGEMENGNYDSAEKLLLKALVVLEKHFHIDHYTIIPTLLQLGHVYRKTAKNAQAEIYFKQAIANYEAMDNNAERLYYLATLEHLANLHLEEGRFDDAEILYRKALTIVDSTYGMHSTAYATSLHSFANVFIARKQYQEAETILVQAVGIMKNEMGEQSEEYVTSISYLANLYVATGNIGKAENLFHQAYTISKQEDIDKRKRLTSVYNLAMYYATVGNFKAAGNLYNEGFSLVNENEPHFFENYFNLLKGAGMFFTDAEEYILADSFYKKTLYLMEISIGENHPQYAEVLLNAASVNKKLGKISLAEEQLKTAESILKKINPQHPSLIHIYSKRAGMYEDTNQKEAAEKYYRLSIELAGILKGKLHPDYAQLMINLALFNWKYNYIKEAASLFLQGTDILLKQYEENMLFFNEEEKNKLFNVESSRFQAMLSFLYEHNKALPGFAREVLTRYMRLKGLILTDATKAVEYARKSNDQELNAALQQWQHLRSMLSHASGAQKIDSIYAAINDQEKFINQRSAIFRNLSQSISFSSFQSKLEQNEIAIDFADFELYKNGRWTDTVIYAAFIINKTDSLPTFVSLTTSDSLSALLRFDQTVSSETYASKLYRGIIIKSTNTNGKDDALYRLVWKPMERYLQKATSIAFAPSGLLHRVAFAAIRDEKKKYLSEKYVLRQFSTLRSISVQQTTNTTPNRILLFGGINYGKDLEESNTISRSNEYAYLPGTLEEVNKIGALFKNVAEIKSDTAATEEYVKSISENSPTIIHLATHGYAMADDFKIQSSSNQKPDPLLRSGIILAGANKNIKYNSNNREDGILTAYEIAHLDLSKTSLVVLSACESALGEIKDTEGVYGLQRAFKIAGVQQMILSLWQVPDKETVELMQQFYENLAAGKSTREAFNNAQAHMRKLYAPYYWAAFILVE